MNYISGSRSLYLNTEPIESYFRSFVDLVDEPLNGLANLLNRIEKDIIDDRFLEPTPKPFDQIELRAIGREIQQGENRLMLGQK
ncbi:hypothetical protein D3C78_1684400 [compost metagenome]